MKNIYTMPRLVRLCEFFQQIFGSSSIAEIAWKTDLEGKRVPFIEWNGKSMP
jgi:hypothetical protein